MATLAARDRENLINAHQTAAASKPLNQNARGLQPKTPFKARIYDENAAITIKGGAKDNIALKTIGKLKQAEFATPAPANQQAARNALAPKTTNAKAKTPGFGLGEKQGYTIRRRSGNRPPSVQKLKPQSDETTTTKLKIPSDEDAEDAWPEIEYMPPRGVPLPDHDEDLVPPIDLAEALKDYDMRNVLRDSILSRYHEPNEDGITQAEIDEQEREETERIVEQREDAEILRNSELAMVFCDCDGACEPVDCPERIPQRAEINARYNAAVADLLTPRERRVKEQQEKATKAAEPKAAPVKTAKTVASDPKARTRTVTTTTTTKIKVKMDPEESATKTASHSRANSRVASRSSSRAGPSDTASRRAASALSMRSDRSEPSKKPSSGGGPAMEKPAKTRNYPKPWLAGSKAASKDTDNSYAGRHAAAAAASRTNLGFSKGRSVSAGLRRTPGAAGKEKQEGGAGAETPQKRITEAQWLQEMWLDLDRRENEEDRKRLGLGRTEPLDHDPEEDFELKLDFGGE